MPASLAPASSPPSYKPIMDDTSIEHLITLAKDLPPDSALGIVWQYTFEEGKWIGYSEGTQMVDRIDINEVLRTGVEKSIEKGIERGIEIGWDWEKHAWGAAGHSTTCITVACPPQGVAIQTDEPPSCPITMVAVQINTLKPPPSLHVAVQADVPLGIQDTNTAAPESIPWLYLYNFTATIHISQLGRQCCITPNFIQASTTWFIGSSLNETKPFQFPPTSFQTVSHPDSLLPLPKKPFCLIFIFSLSTTTIMFSVFSP